MGILAQCPACRRHQGVNKKFCACGENMDKAKARKRVKYWIDYYLPSGKARRECVGTSIEEARDALGKRRSQKREDKFFEIRADSKMTFKELAKWYLNLEKTKALKSEKTVRIYLRKFCDVLGPRIISSVKLVDLENLQERRKREGLKPKTIDHEINTAKGMVIKAFQNDIVSGPVLRMFQNVKHQLKGHANRRERYMSVEEFRKLEAGAPNHLKGILSMGWWTGMRKGEIIGLTWDKVDLKVRMIRLKASDTKDAEPRTIPISDELLNVLRGTPRGLHDPHVFLYNGKPITKRFETAMKTACDNAGIEWGREVEGGLIFHDLRHCFVTDARKAGVDRTVRMAITGHAIRDMDARYDVVSDEDKLEAVKKLSYFRQIMTKVMTEKSN